MIYLQQACFLSCLGWQRKARVTFQAPRIGGKGAGVLLPSKNTDSGCATLLSVSRQAASPQSSLPFIQLCAAAQLLCLPGGGCQVPCLLAASRIPATPHTNTSTHALPRSHTEPHAHASTFLPSCSLSSALDFYKPMEPFWKDALDPAG